GVVVVLQNLFAAVAADALAVLAVDFPAPASEEAFALGCLAAQAEDTAIIIDLLAAVGMVGDGGRADIVHALPARGPDCARAIEVARAIRVTGKTEVPELAPAVLVGLGAIEKEFAECLDLLAQLIGAFKVASDQRCLRDDCLLFDERVIGIEHRLCGSVISYREPACRRAKVRHARNEVAILIEVAGIPI